MIASHVVRIGGAAAHWMDSITAVPQLLGSGVDYLMLDYMAEGALPVFARMLNVDPRSGFAPDFANLQVGPHLAQIMAKKVKVIANAGGLNPDGCAESIRQAAGRAGVSPRIAIVRGDDLRGRIDTFRAADLRDMFRGTPFPTNEILNANVYLGAFPIAEALRRGADIVITGRVADSSLALGPLIAEFGWSEQDYDLLASGTLVGHLLECGCQATGGTFTDWRAVADRWDDVGFPIAECNANGSFILTKPANTGGLVSRGTVAEQMVYEISDPQSYAVADVVCDFSQVKLIEMGPDRVSVTGAKGYPPSGFYKLTVSFDSGWRGSAATPIVGFDAAEKAQRQGEAILSRISRLLKERNVPPFTRTRIEVFGDETTLCAPARSFAPWEVMLWLTVDHPTQEGAGLFIREQHAAITGMAVGTAPSIALALRPLTELLSFLLPRDQVSVSVDIDGDQWAMSAPKPSRFSTAMIERPRMPNPVKLENGSTTVPLIRLAWARSGDKGGSFNIGVIARRPEYLSYIVEAVTEESVGTWFQHTFDDPSKAQVERYLLPGIDAINLYLPDALGGSPGMSDRLDPYAKTMAQKLLAMPVAVPRQLADALGLEHDGVRP